MHLGETTERTKCDDCTKSLGIGTKIWVDVDKGKIHCMDCRTGEGKMHKRAKAEALQEGASKHVIVEHRSKLREDDVKMLKRSNKHLEIRVTDLETQQNRLKTIVRALFEMVRKEPKGRKGLTFDEERLALRRRS